MPADKPSKASCVEGTTEAALGRPGGEQETKDHERKISDAEKQAEEPFLQDADVIFDC